MHLLVEYHNIAPGTEREIFQRVQLGVTLTAAGKCLSITARPQKGTHP